MYLCARVLGGAGRRSAGSAVYGRRRGTGRAAGRRRTGPTGAQPQGRVRAQGHGRTPRPARRAPSEGRTRRGCGGFLAVEPRGARVARPAAGAYIAPQGICTRSGREHPARPLPDKTTEQ